MKLKYQRQLVEYERRQELIKQYSKYIDTLKQQLKQTRDWSIKNKLELRINSLENRIKKNDY